MLRTLFAAALVAAMAWAAPAGAAPIVFADSPTSNSTDWAAQILATNGAINTGVDFETHPIGPLQPEFYAGIGVHISPSNLNYSGAGQGSAGTSPQVVQNLNDYSGTVYGYGPNSSGEGPAPENRVFTAYYSSGPWSLTFSFDQMVLGAGIFVNDLFNGTGQRRVTLEAYDGVDGTGNLLATATAPDYNFQLYNRFFLGIAGDTTTPGIRSVVLTNPIPTYGDGISFDEFRFGTPAPQNNHIPEPGTMSLVLGGLCLFGGAARRKLTARA